MINPTSIAVSVATAVGLLILVFVVWLNAALRPVSSDTTTRLVRIPARGTKALTALLQREHLIRSAVAFRLLTKTNLALQKGPGPRAGYYDLSPSMSAEEILQRLCSGQTARRKVTFPEGYTVRQMAERLQERLQMPAEEVQWAARGAAVERALPFRLPPGLLEGYLFPTTYTVPVGEKPELVVGEMLATFSETFYKPHRQELAHSGLSLHEVVTLASLVEREARLPAERAVIAGVLLNRLRKGMRLQCDATVQYARGQHKSRLRYRDLKVNSPYNTYLHAGLPPGPICNPGLACLQAALQPARTPYLFYVARRNGSHLFTRTYAEHQQAIARARAGG